MMHKTVMLAALVVASACLAAPRAAFVAADTSRRKGIE
jgi:hypothetical protein